MKYTNIIKKEIKVMLVVVVILLMVVLGVSYALFMQVTDNTNNQVLTTGSLQIEYASTNGYIENDTYKELLPMSNDQGLLQSGYEFSVKNTGSLPVAYNVYLYVNEEEYNKDVQAGTISGSLFDNLSLIHYNLQTNDDGNKNINILSEQTIKEEDGITKYVLHSDEVSSKTNTINNHKLRIWLSEDIDVAEIGKYIYLKLEVTSYVKGQEPKVCKLTKDENSDGIADIGDMITCDTESFYVYNNDGETIKMLAQYNLYVGGDYNNTTSTYTPYGEEATGLQNSNMLGYVYGQDIFKGTTPFSNDEISGNNYNDYEGSIVENYVKAYEHELNKMGIKFKKISIISMDDLLELSSLSVIESGHITSWAPEWLYNSTYWVQQIYDTEQIGYINTDGYFSYITYDQTLGVRPAVYISVDEI